MDSTDQTKQDPKPDTEKQESESDQKKEGLQPLLRKWQIRGFGITLALIILLSVAIYALMYFTKTPPVCNTDPKIFDTLLWVIVSGFIGGAGRSMFKLITQLNEKDKAPELYLQRWFLYLLKPFMGSVGGLFFFFCVYLGMVSLSPVKDVSDYDFRRVCLTGILGGIFFEHVFALLEKFMPGLKDETDGTKANNKLKNDKNNPGP